MATTGTAALTAEVRPAYSADFYLAGQSMVYWDQLADLRKVMNGQPGQSHNFPIVESLAPNTGVLDELSDVVAQQMRANEVVVTLQEHGGAVEVTKLVVALSYADVYKQAAFVNGYNLAESFDFVARAVAGQGSRQFYQNSRTARAQFSGVNTAADRLTTAFIELMTMFSRTVKMPLYDDGAVCSVIHPFLHYDILQDNTIRTMSQYSHPELLFNGEMAYWAGMRMIVSSNAKGFWGAGAANPVGALDTTLSAAAAVGDTTITLTSVAGLVVGQWLTIREGTETGNTWFDTNELFRITGIAGNVVTGFALDPGPGDGGGLRYAHANGTAVSNDQSVFPLVVLGPNSITKAASDFTGPYGETIVTGPFDRLGRFLNFGWYAIVGYSRTRNAWLFRGECGSSQS